MANTVAKHEGTGGNVRTQDPIKVFRTDLEAMKPQFEMVLQRAVPVERFARVIATAFNNNPKLHKCTKQSLMAACMQAATDQLLPDGKQGAIVPYGEDEEGRGRSEIARWMPMIAGIRAKVLASGKLTDWNVQAVYDGDEFDFQLGDEPFIHHKPSMHGGRTRKVIAAYSIATFPDGTKSREVMNGDMIDDIRKKSKAKRGPWSDPVFYGEMARKTVARLHAKQLPTLNDFETVIGRDDDMYDLTSPPAPEQRPRIKPPGSARAVLDHFASGGDEPAPVPHDDDVPHTIDGEVLPSPPTQHEGVTDGEASTAGHSTEGNTEAAKEAKPPTNEAEYRAFAEAHIDAATGDPRDLNDWWQSADQRRLRNACAVLKDTFDALAARVKDKCAALEGAS